MKKASLGISLVGLLSFCVAQADISCVVTSQQKAPGFFIYRSGNSEAVLTFQGDVVQSSHSLRCKYEPAQENEPDRLSENFLVCIGTRYEVDIPLQRNGQAIDTSSATVPQIADAQTGLVDQNYTLNNCRGDR